MTLNLFAGLGLDPPLDPQPSASWGQATHVVWLDSTELAPGHLVLPCVLLFMLPLPCSPPINPAFCARSDVNLFANIWQSVSRILITPSRSLPACLIVYIHHIPRTNMHKCMYIYICYMWSVVSSCRHAKNFIQYLRASIKILCRQQIENGLGRSGAPCCYSKRSSGQSNTSSVYRSECVPNWSVEESKKTPTLTDRTDLSCISVDHNIDNLA